MTGKISISDCGLYKARSPKTRFGDSDSSFFKRPTRDGQTTKGLSSPEYPTFTCLLPISIIRLETSSK